MRAPFNAAAPSNNLKGGFSDSTAATIAFAARSGSPG
jgi:hypothetical protein